MTFIKYLLSCAFFLALVVLVITSSVYSKLPPDPEQDNESYCSLLKRSKSTTESANKERIEEILKNCD